MPYIKLNRKDTTNYKGAKVDKAFYIDQKVNQNFQAKISKTWKNLKQQDFSLTDFKISKKMDPGLFLYNFSLFVNRSSSRYFWFTRWLCLYIHPPLLKKNISFDEFGDYGDFIPYGGWCWALTNMQVQIVLRHATSREKPNYLVDLEKPVKTGKLLLALGKLIGLMRFRAFLIMKKYYKNSISLLIFRYKF